MATISDKPDPDWSTTMSIESRALIHIVHVPACKAAIAPIPENKTKKHTHMQSVWVSVGHLLDIYMTIYVTTFRAVPL